MDVVLLTYDVDHTTTYISGDGGCEVVGICDVWPDMKSDCSIRCTAIGTSPGLLSFPQEGLAP